MGPLQPSILPVSNSVRNRCLIAGFWTSSLQFFKSSLGLADNALLPLRPLAKTSLHAAILEDTGTPAFNSSNLLEDPWPRPVCM